ncbi:MAG: histidine kinase [Gammaproteobacteria bacterium]|nr:histidine kinase [Gammaproteobacteria bacterium]
MTAAPDKPRSDACNYLPDLCAPAAVLGVVLVAELGAIVMALARQSQWVSFFTDLGRTSVVLQWLSLTSAAVLCVLRPRIERLALREGTAIALVAVMLNILLVSEALYWATDFIAPGMAADGWLPADHWFFAARNLAIGGIVACGLLRYFYVSAQWQDNVRREATARIHALQARIRPHFLFNSMNTIASLIRGNPAAAEQAVEDLADLFRASLSEARQRITLTEELEIARVYERMEQQRLGERLRVEWDIAALPGDAILPSLTLQPLLENAVYHGIERLPDPGVVQVRGRRDGDRLEVQVVNPVPVDDRGERSGNRIALANIGERLQLAFGAAAGLQVESGPTEFRVTLMFPYRTDGR